MKDEDIEVIKGALESIINCTNRLDSLCNIGIHTPICDKSNMIATIRVKAKDTINYIKLFLEDKSK